MQRINVYYEQDRRSGTISNCDKDRRHTRSTLLACDLPNRLSSSCPLISLPTHVLVGLHRFREFLACATLWHGLQTGKRAKVDQWG